MKKIIICTMLGIGILGFGIYLFGCGQSQNSGGGGGGTVPDYTISGKVGTISTLGLKSAENLEVTHIVAIGRNNQKYSATPDSNGNFSLKVVSGWPYAIGFYNQGNSKITLLGYLRKNQVNWESLPLMYPATSETNVGTVEINRASVEATPSIALSDLLSQLNMDTAAANLYGNIDNLMTAFTNVDVDGNGIFDFQENKSYLLDIIVQVGKSNGVTSGELDMMLNKWYDNYYAIPHSYQFFFYAVEGSGGSDKPASGTQATLNFPQTVYDMTGIGKTSIIGQTSSSGYGWSIGTFGGDSTASTYTTPEVVPSGCYTYEVSGRGTYSFKNINGAPGFAVGASENIVYPIFKLTTNEAGIITTIHYKWMIRQNGTTREATEAEVKAQVSHTDSSSDGFVMTSPTIGIQPKDDTKYYAPKQIGLTTSFVDISDWNVKTSDIVKLVGQYNLNSNLDCRWYFFR